jgi:hypothetical protein
MSNKRSKVEVASIFAARPDFFEQQQAKFTDVQKKAFNDILKCRTAQLGGHLQICDKCNHTKQAYNSCRNRHCPKCQFVKKEKWIDKLSGNLPPVKYFHLVFTIPECLNKLFYINQKEAYNLLFNAASKAITQVAKNTNFLGAKPGAVGVLHTWGQTLSYHPHIHMIVPAGGLSEDNSEWIPSHEKFFLPVKVLSAIFRGILCKAIENSIVNKTIKLPDENASFQSIKNACYKTKWVVYSEKPFNSPENLINYLGNYTHRVAISNQRVLEHRDGKVTFSYKDYKSAGIRKTITLDEEEFIRRFLQHILPLGFSKIRYFGFLALRHIKTNLDNCCSLLDKTVRLPKFEGLNDYEVIRSLFKMDPICCEKCKKGRYINTSLKRPNPT